MKKENEEQIVILGPGGEDREKFLNLLEFAGFAVVRPTNERTYSVEILPNAICPYSFLIVLARSNDVGQIMEDNPEQVSAAITGENIWYEQEKKSDFTFDFATLSPYSPTLFSLFGTPNSKQRPELAQLTRPIEWGSFLPTGKQAETLRATLQQLLIGTRVYTSFPRAARDFFGSADLSIIKKSGKIEVLWLADKSNLASADISDTKQTAKANGLSLFQDLDRVDQLGVVISPGASPEATRAVSEFSNQILKLPQRMGGTDPRVRRPITLEELNTIGSIKYFFVAGLNQGKWATAPVLFDEYWQTADKAKSLLQNKGNLYRRDDSDLSWIVKRLEATAEPEIISMINQALQNNGYLLIPKVFTNYLRWLSSPNLDKGGH